MPVYEYYCVQCDGRFDVLRPMSEANAPMSCPRCKAPDSRKLISACAAISRDESGSRLVTGGGGSGCASCGGGNCSTCASH